MVSRKFPIYIAKSKIHGKGSFAKRNIKRGELINIFGGKEYNEQKVDQLIKRGKLRSDDAFQIDEDLWLVGPGLDYFINHSCNPSAGIKNLKEIIAIRDIKKDEEITIDYSTSTGIQKTESDYRNDAWTMDCNCQEKNCRSTVGYILSLPKPTIEKYSKLGIIPEFIRKDIKL